MNKIIQLYKNVNKHFLSVINIIISFSTLINYHFEKLNVTKNNLI